MSAVQALRIDDLTPRTNALQSDVSHNPSRHLTKFLHRNAPGSSPSVPVTWTEADRMTSPNFHRTLGDRVSEALWRRINSGAINRKHLQHALGVSAGTIDNLLNGSTDPSGRVLMGLITFFDAAFANEILEGTGCTVAKIGDARANALRKVAEGMAELQRMEGR